MFGLTISAPERLKLTPPSSIGGNRNDSNLWNFGNGADGANPVASLITDCERQALQHDQIRRGSIPLCRTR
jgi:hypothetical protein